MAKIRLLLVDDDEHLVKSLKLRFRDLGYIVYQAVDGKEAVEVFDAERPDIVLCDVVMPKLNGIEVLGKIKAIDNNTSFLMLTGHPSIDSCIDAMKKGADDYLIKPLDTNEVHMKIERTLANKYYREKSRASQKMIIGLILSIPIWIIFGILLSLQLLRR